MKHKYRMLLVFVLLLMLTHVSQVFAVTYNATAPEYVFLTASNSSVTEAQYMMSDTSAATGNYFSTVYVSWKVQAGDTGRIDWYDTNYNVITSTDLGTGMNSMNVGTTGALTAPGSSYYAKITLNSGSVSGNRYLYYTEVDNQVNSILYPAPDTSNYVNNGSAPASNTTYQDVLNALYTFWGKPSQPGYNSAPSVSVVKPLVPNVSAYNYPFQSMGNLNVSGTVDNGGHAQSVSVPSYSDPGSVPSPLALPSPLDPVQALSNTPKLPGVPRQVPLVRGGVLTVVNTLKAGGVMARNQVLNRSQVLTANKLMVSPVMTVQQFTLQAWVRQPVLGVK